MADIERPKLTFEMFQAGLRGGVAATRVFKEFFGTEDYDFFKRANSEGVDIPEIARRRVDRRVYDKVRTMFDVMGSKISFWRKAIGLANDSVNYARNILFPDQDRQATLTTNIDWSDRRPSSALEILTTPTRMIGEQCRYEQGRQLGLALLCAELMKGDENGEANAMLSRVNKFFEKKLFQGRKGDPKRYETFSYHDPETNKLVGFSRQYPDPDFDKRLWVKSLVHPVRMVRVGSALGTTEGSIPTLYDPREKETGAAVIKALHRSLKEDMVQPNGGMIEPSRYWGDRLGVRLVLMEGDRPLRDKLTADLEGLFWGFDGVYQIKPDDDVDPKNGQSNRVEFRRRQIYIKGLKHPFEMIIQLHEHYLSQLYEVGKFEPAIGMHNGVAHDLYKFDTVARVAEYLWPQAIFGIDLAAEKKSSSFEYAARLGRKQRISPPPYIEI